MKKIFTLTLFLVIYNNYSQFRSDIDFSFSNNINALEKLGWVSALEIQSDGKILVGQKHIKGGNTTSKYLKRLNTDGKLDYSFAESGSNFTLSSDDYAQVSNIKIQPDGKILVALCRSCANGSNSTDKSLVRLNSNGEIDTGFTFNTFVINNSCFGLALQNDGKILVGGEFIINGKTIKGLIRLNANGSVDSSFNLTGSGLDAKAEKIIVNPDGKILVSGPHITSYNGFSSRGIVKLNNDGSRDVSFYLGSGFENGLFGVKDIEIQSDGKILVGGGFQSFNGNTNCKYLVRLDENGVLENEFTNAVKAEFYASFSLNYGNHIKGITIQPDGMILVSAFTRDYQTNLYNLSSSGNLSGTGFGDISFDSDVVDCKIQSDGKILVGGYFGSYNGYVAKKLIRLKGQTALSVNDSKIKDLIIFPNPVRETVNIQNMYDSFKSEFEIFNVLGKKVYFGKFKDNKIDISNISKGIYFLKLGTKNNVITTKFIKE